MYKLFFYLNLIFGINTLFSAATIEIGVDIISERLFDAVKEANFKKIETLIDQGADVNGLMMINFFGGSASESPVCTPLVAAILYGRYERKSKGVVSLVFDRTTKNYKNCGSDIIALLLKKGANVDARDKSEYTALMHLIASKESANHSLQLIDFASVRKTEMDRIKKYSELIKLFINKTQEIDACDFYGNTALILAVRNNDLDTIGALLDAGADLHKENNKGESAYKIAHLENNADITKLIDEHIKFKPSAIEMRKAEVISGVTAISNLPKTLINLIAEYEADYNSFFSSINS